MLHLLRRRVAFQFCGAECLTRTDDLPLTVPLRLSPPAIEGRSWAGLSLSHSPWALGSPRLVSTPSPDTGAWLGIGLAVAALAFPEFEELYSSGFPKGTRAIQGGCSTN